MSRYPGGAVNAGSGPNVSGRGACLALLTLLAVYGCGGSSLSSSELRDQAGAICAAAQTHTDRVPAPGSPAGAAAFIRQGTGLLSAELARLQALRPAGDLAGAYRVSLLAFSRELHALRHTARVLARGSDPVIAIKTLQRRLAPIQSEEDHAWRTLGISACVNR